MSTVLDVERAYVAAATGVALSPGDPARLAEALACAGAVASRYLAVGTPRTFGVIGTRDDLERSLAAHRTWFAPREIRHDTDALGCDIVCVHTSIAIVHGQLRRGTHVNLLAPCTLDGVRADIVADEAALAAMAAGLRDGRQLDELTVFVAGTAAIALAGVSR
jgi:hypothetical protein